MLLALASLALYIAALVQGLSITKETNAKRLAQRLPPLKPKRLFDPSRTGPAPARRSIIPSVQGLIAVANGDGSLSCFLQDGVCGPGNTDPSYGATFSAMVGYVGQQPVYSVDLLPSFNLAVEHGGYFNGTSGSLDSGSLTIVDANETPGTYNTNGIAEGGIWTLDPLDDNHMTATWTNSDNTHVALSFLQNDNSDFIYACADCDAFSQNQYSDGGADDGPSYDVVYLYFVPT